MIMQGVRIGDGGIIAAFYFERAKSSQRTLIHTWLAQPHIKEWVHGVGLQNTLI